MSKLQDFHDKLSPELRKAFREASEDAELTAFIALQYFKEPAARALDILRKGKDPINADKEPS